MDMFENGHAIPSQVVAPMIWKSNYLRNGFKESTPYL